MITTSGTAHMRVFFNTPLLRFYGYHPGVDQYFLSNMNLYVYTDDYF